MYSYHWNSSTAETPGLFGGQPFLLPQWGMGMGPDDQ